MNKKILLLLSLLLIFLIIGCRQPLRRLILLREVRQKTQLDSAATTPIHFQQIPSQEEIFGYIKTIVAQGTRRAGYPADVWVENYIIKQFQKWGLENVHKEAVTHHGKNYTDEPEINLKWTPLKTNLTIYNNNQSINIPAFSVPLSASTDENGIKAEIVPLQSQRSNRAAAGKIALYPIEFRDGVPHRLLQRIAEWYYDPENTFRGTRLPPVISRERQEPMRYAIDSGAVGFIGVITNNPDPELYQYYMPTFGEAQPIPGVYVSEGDGEKIKSLIQQGPTKARLVSQVSIEPFISHNIIGTLPGQSNQWVVISGHHDGLFDGAVEGGSSVAMVLAQAKYWASVPKEERPHNLLFLVTSGHLCGVTGGWSFVKEHKDLLKDIVLEITLQNIALEYEKRNGKFSPTGKSQPRFWFTTPNVILMRLVKEAIVSEKIDRSYIFKPDAIDKKTKLPNSDGAFFYKNGVPIVNLVSSPAYLFTYADGLEKVDKEALVPITRAIIRLINGLEGVSAEQTRSVDFSSTINRRNQYNLDFDY